MRAVHGALQSSISGQSYRPIEPIAPPDVGCCSKIGHGFASLRNVAKGQVQKRRIDTLNAVEEKASFSTLSVESALDEKRQLRTMSTRQTKWADGQLLHIHIAPTASAIMEEIAEASLVAGRGIEGDRYFLGSGTYSHVKKPDFREVTLFEMEVLDALLRNDPPLQSGPIKISPADHRRNLTVLGVPLNHLVGKRFRVGDVVLFGGRLNFPCKYLEKLLGLPLYLPLYNRSGLNCVIEKAGVIRRGDLIEPLDA